jgi:MFS family permease
LSQQDKSIMPLTTPLSSSGLLYLLSSSVWVAMIGMGIVWPLVPVYARQMGASGLQVGLVISSFSIARAFFNPFVGRMSDLRGRKPLICSGLLLYAVVSVCYILAARVETLMAVRFFHGFTSVLVIPVAMALAGDLAPKDRLGRYLGTLQMAIMLGLGVGPILGGMIRESFGMEVAFLSMGGLALVTFVAVAVFIPSGRSVGAEVSRRPAPMREVLANRIVKGLFFLRFISAAGQGSVYTFLPLLGLKGHLTSGQVGVILGLNILVIASLQRLGGAAADRWKPLYLILGGAFLSGAAVASMPLARGFGALLLLNICMGTGGGLALPSGLALAARVGRRIGMGSVIGVTDTGWSLGMIASPIVSGLLMDFLGIDSIFFIGGALVGLGNLFVFLYLKGDSQTHQSKG